MTLSLSGPDLAGRALLCLIVVALAACPLAAQGHLLLAGGGGEGADGDPSSWSFEPYGWFVGKALAGGPNGGNGRILVIDYEEYPECGVPNVGYCAYFESLGAVEAEAIWLSKSCPADPDCVSSNDPAVLPEISSYDGIWFRGGDQSKYVGSLKNSVAERAIFMVFDGGGVLGGTSAGAMILSEVASVGDAPSYEATANPYHPALKLEYRFLSGRSAVLPATIVDTHLTQRARLGRLMVFLGRTWVDAGQSLLGIGIDPETAVTVESDGIATVYGEGAVSFVQLTGASEVELQAGKPPYISSLRVEQLTEGFVYDIPNRAMVSVSRGADPAGSPPASVEFGNGGLSGVAGGSAGKGEWWADWGGDDLALYEGTLVSVAGNTLLENTAVVPLLEEQSSLRENRAGGAQWLLQQNPHHGLIIYLDGFNGQEFNRVRVHDDETLRVVEPKSNPEESVLLLDCWGMEWVAHSTWDADGNGLPRQSVALTPCHAHLLNSEIGKKVYDVGAHQPSD